jgi:cholesterol oxidase
MVVTAPNVFVCAGAVNSTELLLRCRDKFRTLPHLPKSLGESYSANGDFLAFAFDTGPVPYQPNNGPVITTGIVYDNRSQTERTWFVFEDGGYPHFAEVLLQLFNVRDDPKTAVTVAMHELADAIKHHAGEVAAGLREENERAAVFLVMGRDRANGRIELRSDDWLRVRWDDESNLPLYVLESALCNDIAESLGGRYVESPAWKYLARPVSVHNLGGCPMADSQQSGVVDSEGEVYGYPGLYVLDGAIIPKATGANPSHTITAVAERCIEQAIRRITGNANWRAPEFALVKKRDLPEDLIKVPASGTLAPKTQLVGMKFTETMRGSLNLVGTPNPEAGPQRLNAHFKVTIASSDLASFLEDTTHPAAATGTVWVDGYTTDEGSEIVGGVFNLFTATDSPYKKNMLYHLPFIDIEGDLFLLEGYKEVWDHGRFDVWASTTTLYTSLVRLRSKDSSPVATGILRLDLPMFARQMGTMRITGTSNPFDQLKGATAFGKFFTTTLFDVFVKSKIEA